MQGTAKPAELWSQDPAALVVLLFILILYEYRNCTAISIWRKNGSKDTPDNDKKKVVVLSS